MLAIHTRKKGGRKAAPDAETRIEFIHDGANSRVFPAPIRAERTEHARGNPNLGADVEVSQTRPELNERSEFQKKGRQIASNGERPSGIQDRVQAREER
jgi:hypothetical protein